MTHTDLTIDEVLEDPLIKLMMRADGITKSNMRALLVETAARISE